MRFTCHDSILDDNCPPSLSGVKVHVRALGWHDAGRHQRWNRFEDNVVTKRVLKTATVTTLTGAWLDVARFDARGGCTLLVSPGGDCGT